MTGGADTVFSCDDVSDKDQKDARAKLAEIVRCSKAVAAEGNTVAKIQLLANLNQYTSQLLELVRSVTGFIISVNAHANQKYMPH